MAVESDGNRVGEGCHFEGRRGHKAYISPSFMATHSVIADHADSPLDPVPPKQADATSIPISSVEKPLFLPILYVVVSSSCEDAKESFFKSIASEGLSKDHLFVRSSSHTRTAASAVTVTRQLPATPQGCQRTLATGGCDKT